MGAKSTRPIPFYFINTDRPEELNRTAAERAMQRLKTAGFGGGILFNVPPDGFSSAEYLSPYWFEVTENFVLAARKLDLELWFTDGWRCPPGDVGGKIAEINADLRQQRLVKNASGEVEVCDVEWGFPAFEEPESSRLFIELVYEKYKKYLGQYFGKGITGIFTDADNRRVNHPSLEILKGKPYFPWTKNFAEGFASEYGYRIEPYLSGILDGLLAQQTSDYYHYCEKLYLQWFANNYQWCRNNGLKYTFHTSDTGPYPLARCPRSSIFTEGNPFSVFRNCDFPGTDHESLALDGGTPYDFERRFFCPKASRGGDDRLIRTSTFSFTKNDLRAKYAASAAFFYGKEGAMCELFAVTNWGATPNDLRRIAAWQILQGINFLVPNGVMHKFARHYKYAPPQELLHGLGGSIVEINAYISKYSTIASKGKFAPRILLADPSETVLRGGDSETFFEYCDRLNHAGISFAIVPENVPGAIKVPCDKIPGLPQRDFSFTGGDLCAMRRQLPDGSIFLLLCNLWSETELKGTLTFQGRVVDLLLAPGEFAVVGGPHEEYRSPYPPANCMDLTFPARVTFGELNSVPFHYNSSWQIDEALPKVFLRIPEEFVAVGVKYDGVPLENGTPVKIFEDDYMEFAVSGHVGMHSFELAAWHDRPQDLKMPPDTSVEPGTPTEEDYMFHLPVYLCGEFSVKLQIEGEFDHQVFCYSNLTMYMPRVCKVFLSKRAEMLESGSWAEQGEPFYSGSVTYHFDLNLRAEHSRLEMRKAAVRVEVVMDGISKGCVCFEPYHLDLGRLSGNHHLEIKVTNTLANQLDEYRAASGLISGAVIKYWQHES